MNISLHRPIALGATAALCLGLAALPSVAPAQAAPATTILTGAEAKAALVSAVSRTRTRLLAEGGKQRSTIHRGKGSRGWVVYTRTVTVDPKRHTAAQSAHVTRGSSGGLHGDPCDPGYPDVVGRYRDVVKDGVARWSKLRTPNDRIARKLLDRPEVRWAKRPNAEASVTKYVHTSVVGNAFGSYFFTAYHVTEGTSVANAAGGRTVTLTYRDDYQPKKLYGTVAFDTASDGALTRMSIVDADLAWIEPGRDRSEYRFVYGAQHVAVPAKKHTIAKSVLDVGCRAAVAWTTPAETATWAAILANRQARGGHVAMSPKLIRNWARPVTATSFRDQIDWVNIRYGIEIIGHHPLLKHDSVWTVFVRDGKAVAHKVR